MATAASSLAAAAWTPDANAFDARASKEAESAPPFKVSTGLSHGFQKYTGLTWMSERAAGAATGAYLSLRTHGWVSTKIRSYGLTDLLAGRFKSMDIRARGGKFHSVPFGNVHAVCSTPFQVHFFKRKDQRAGLAAPILVALDGDIDKAQLSRALRSPKVTDGLRFLKFDLPGLGAQRLSLLDPHVELLDDKLKVDSYMVTAGAPRESGIKVQVIGKVLLDRDRYLRLQDMEVQSSDIATPQYFGPFLEELLNPLVDFGRYDRNTHAFRLQKLEIEHQRVSYAGRLVLAPKK
ncbi:MAG TPA: hypothetical protein V6D22_15640 [Candidatus Obscuribacterales bacterium]